MLFSISNTHAAGDDWDDALEVLANAKASDDPSALASAWQTIADSSSDSIPAMLVAINDGDPVGANWIATAIDAVLERSSDSDLDIESLVAFVQTEEHAVLARKTAYDALSRYASDAAEQLIPELVNDPVAEFRRPGVQQLIDRATKLTEEEAAEDDRVDAYREALGVARDSDQVRVIATALEELGHPVDLADHFGYVQAWYIVGPFANEDSAGFDSAYPPESISLDQVKQLDNDVNAFDYEGKSDTVRWTEFQANERTGNVDLNEAIAQETSVVGYGAAIIRSEEAADAQLRLRIQNSFKIWLNGELLMAQPIGHTGNFFDQYKLDVQLNAGDNLIVVKSCQVEPLQEIDFFKIWHFGVRVTDHTGAAFSSAQ